METQLSASVPYPALETRNVNKRFGGVIALDDAKICCQRGETHVLIGENGAGKSTLVKIICGVIKKDSGDIFIEGENITDIHNERDAERYKIASVFQELSLIPYLSVAENIMLGHEIIGKFGRINFSRMYESCDLFLKKIGLTLNSQTLIKNLTLCEKQLVEIAKALIKNPEILILDEATSALGEKEVEWLFEKVKSFTRDENKTVIFISHRMDELHRIADRATIFKDAHFIKTFKWGEMSEEDIVTSISGRRIEDLGMKPNKPISDEVILRVSNGYLATSLRNINFQVKKGEILGIAGLSGHGQVKLLHSLYGDNPFDVGSIHIHDTKVQLNCVSDALNAGIVLVPDDRKNDGLMLERPIGENITLTALRHLSKLGVIDKTRTDVFVKDSIKKLNIKVEDTSLNVNSLSGGNQQKVVIAKSLLNNTKIVLFSDPTRGIDVGTKNEIYKLMHKLAQEGLTFLFFSTEVSELIRLCSRVLVFYEGRIFAELVDDEITESNIISAAIGIWGKQ